MNHITRAALFAAAMTLSAGAFAQSTTTSTTTTWTDDQGAAITSYSTTQKYPSITDPAMQPVVGTALPETVTVYSLPETIKVEDPSRYSYSIINNHPVLIDRLTRKVVHIWN